MIKEKSYLLIKNSKTNEITINSSSDKLTDFDVVISEPMSYQDCQEALETSQIVGGPY